jgi:hypothetical protein
MEEAMSSTLRKRFEALCTRALRTDPEDDLDPAVEALGYALWLGAIGAKDQIPTKTSSALTLLGHRALDAIHTGPTDTDEDSAAVNATLAAIVHGALWHMRGSGKTNVMAWQRLAPRAHPSTATFARLLAGTADGLTAGRCGLHVATCDVCRRELNVLQASSTVQSRVAEAAGVYEAAEPLRLAAAEVAHVRAPSEGVVVGRRDKPAIEAVLFNDTDARRLALYTERGDVLRVVADGATTEDVLPGYWLGKLDAKVKALETKVSVAGKTVTWTLPVATVSAQRTGAKRSARASKSPVAKRKPRRRT